MISTILLLNLRGEVLIWRAYKDDVSHAEWTQFSNRVVAAKEARDKPVQSINGCHFIHTTQGDIVLVAATKNNVNVVLVLKLLYKMVDIFRAYFGGTFDENQIRRHFVLIYELLDETIDYGYPQILEADILKKYITQGARTIDLNDQEQLKKITVQATGVCSWRAEGIRYKKNEVYIDVVENVNILMSAKRERLRADVSGQIQVKCRLSGMPNCKFGMNDKLVVQSDQRGGRPSDTGIALDDYRFHQCVRLSKFDVDREITFTPPDGQFELMTYRITDNIDSPFKLLPNVKVLGRNRLELSLQVTGLYDGKITAVSVKIEFPCPKNTARCHMHNVSSGKAKYEATQGAITWRIRRFPGRQESNLLAEIELASTVTDKAWVRPPITMSFDVPQFTASGLRVRFLKVDEKSNYKPVKWIRYLTKAGSYEHRI